MDFLAPIRVLSVGSHPVQVLSIRSNPGRVLSIRFDPVRSDPGFVKHGAILYNEAELFSLPIPANHKFQCDDFIGWEMQSTGF